MRPSDPDSASVDGVPGYTLGRTLGEGAFAKVKAAIHDSTGLPVAIKLINKQKIKEDYVWRHLHREGTLMRRLNHPHVIQLYEVIETPSLYCLVTEVAEGGEVLDYIVAHGSLNEKETRKFIRQLVAAVDHLHKANIVHRDLKVENLLLDEQLNIKIIDFGLSNAFEANLPLQTQCGSPAYTAPELLCGKDYGPEVDVWSIGVNMYAMLTGRLPFASNNVATLHALILEQKYRVPDSLSRDCKDLIGRLLTVKPKERITLEEVMRHPWMNEGFPPMEPDAGVPVSEEPNPRIVNMLVRSGMSERNILYSVKTRSCDSVYAAHKLLEIKVRKTSALRRKPMVRTQSDGMLLKLAGPEAPASSPDTGSSAATTDHLPPNAFVAQSSAGSSKPPTDSGHQSPRDSSADKAKSRHSHSRSDLVEAYLASPDRESPMTVSANSTTPSPAKMRSLPTPPINPLSPPPIPEDQAPLDFSESGPTQAADRRIPSRRHSFSGMKSVRGMASPKTLESSQQQRFNLPEDLSSTPGRDFATPPTVADSQLSELVELSDESLGCPPSTQRASAPVPSQSASKPYSSSPQPHPPTRATLPGRRSTSSRRSVCMDPTLDAVPQDAEAAPREDASVPAESSYSSPPKPPPPLSLRRSGLLPTPPRLVLGQQSPPDVRSKSPADSLKRPAKLRSIKTQLSSEDTALEQSVLADSIADGAQDLARRMPTSASRSSASARVLPVPILPPQGRRPTMPEPAPDRPAAAAPAASARTASSRPLGRPAVSFELGGMAFSSGGASTTATAPAMPSTRRASIGSSADVASTRRLGRDTQWAVAENFAGDQDPSRMTRTMDDGLRAPTNEPQPTDMKTLRYPLNRQMVSPKRPGTVFAALQLVLLNMELTFSAGESPHCLVVDKGELTFEADIVKIPRLHMYGVHFRRVRGPPQEYKDICTEIIASLQL
eukprot:m.332677 g.332677  ORF g.332677 m.332677 type:complete len:945 (+) comp55640_c0_seq2:220-3054(+)